MIFIAKLSFTFHFFVKLIHTSTTAKEPKNGPVNALKEECQSYVCYFWNRKKREKKVGYFLFLPHNNIAMHCGLKWLSSLINCFCENFLGIGDIVSAEMSISDSV